MKRGYAKIWRCLLESDFWKSEPFTKPQAWVDLFGLANHAEQTIWIRGVPKIVKRGQTARSEVTLAKKWTWSRNKVRRFLKWLEEEQQISIESDNITTLITITNYHLYQGDDPICKTAESNNVNFKKNKKNFQKNTPFSEQQAEQQKSEEMRLNNNILCQKITFNDTADRTPSETPERQQKDTKRYTNKNDKHYKHEKNIYNINTCSEPSNEVSEPLPQAILKIPLNSIDKKTSLPMEHSIYQSNIDTWQELFPGIDVLSEVKKLTAWNIANKTKRKSKSGIERHIVLWLTKAQDKGGINNVSTSKGKQNYTGNDRRDNEWACPEPEWARGSDTDTTLH